MYSLAGYFKNTAASGKLFFKCFLTWGEEGGGEGGGRGEGACCLCLDIFELYICSMNIGIVSSFSFLKGSSSVLLGH